MRFKALALCLLTAFTATVHADPPADGLLSTTWGLFNSGRNVVAFDANPTVPSDSGHAGVADAQDRTYIAGTVHTLDGDHIGITRLLTNGLIDVSYGTNGTTISTYPATGGDAAVLDAQGDLLVGGLRTYSGQYHTDFALCRFDPHGNPVAFEGNPSEASCVTIPFDNNLDNKNYLRDIAVQPDGKIVLAGYSDFSSEMSMGTVVRLNADGTPDSSFANGGTLQILTSGHARNRFQAVVVAPNGKIVLAGDSSKQPAGIKNGLLVRLKPTGEIDSTFKDYFYGSPLRQSMFTDLVLEPALGNGMDNNIYAVGTTTNGDGAFLRRGWVTKVTSAGSVMLFYANNGNAYFWKNEEFISRNAWLESDGSLVVSGYTTLPSNNLNFAVFRLTPSGKLDISFNAPHGCIDIDILESEEWDKAYGMVVHPNRYVIFGETVSGSSNLNFAAAAVTRDRIFADGVDKQ